MSSVVQSTDFTGVYKVPDDALQTALVQEVIDIWEAKYLNYLLGCDLATLFLANLENGVPQDAIYLALYNAFCTDDNERIIESDGMKTMLKGLIWGHIAEQFDTTLSTAGIKKNDSANSENAGLQVSKMYNLFNAQVNSYRAIQWYICENSSDYPVYNGQPIKLASWL